MPSLIGLVGHIYGLDTVKQVQDWISTGGTRNHHPQEHGNCKKTQDFSCVKIDYDHQTTPVFWLFALILYVPVNNFQLCWDGSSWVEPVISIVECVLLKDTTL